MKEQQPQFDATRMILLATDLSVASRATAKCAIRLARSLGAPLTVLHVFECTLGSSAAAGGIPIGLERLRDDVAYRLHVMVEWIQSFGIPVTEELHDGDPTAVILDYARSHEASLILLGSYAETRLDRFFVGSTSERVLRSATCSVLVAGPHAFAKSENSTALTTVLCATTLNDVSLPAIAIAKGLAHHTGARLRLCHILPASMEPKKSSHLFEEILTDAMRHQVDQCGPAVDVECGVVYGDQVSRTICQEAENIDADLIVLGVRHASNLSTHGSPATAAQVIAQAPCAVLTIAS